MRLVVRLVPGLVLLAALVLGGLPAAAQAPGLSAERAAGFVQGVGNRIVGLLAAPGTDDRALRQQIEGIVHESVDLEAIGRSSLGSAWQRASDSQRREYQQLFATWAASAYAERLGANRGGSLTVLGATPSGPDAYVRARIARADGRASTLDLRVRETPAGIRIVDAEVDGVSLDVTQRDEFASVVRRQGLDALIASLRRQVDGGAPMARN